MPLYNAGSRRGYDLEHELEYLDHEGQRLLLGSSGSLILACPVCGDERFRERFEGFETCWNGHGKMVLRTMQNRDQLDAAWVKSTGGRLTTIEERKANRLKKEAEQPHMLAFGDKTEADFPKGYVDSSGD